MSALSELIVSAPGREVHDFLRRAMDHVELVSEDLLDVGGDFVGVLLYQQYFMRAKNRAALLLIVTGRGAESKVKAVATGSSEGILFDFDWGAAEAFAGEPLELLRKQFRTREV